MIRYFFLNLCILSISMGCRSQGQPDLISNELQGATGKKYCGVPNESDFSATEVESQSESAILDVQSSPKFTEAKTILKIQSPSEKNWILNALTPLNMGCDSFHKKGILAYGKESYVSFANLLLSLYLPPKENGLAPLSTKFKSSRSNDLTSQYPIVDMLRTINVKVTDNPLGKTRVAGEKVLDSNPLSDQQLTTLKENMKEGILTSYHYDKPWKNAYGDMVTGDFLGYAKGSNVERHLKEMNDVFINETRSSNEQKYIEATARMVRRCVGIHPFHDGNGRSCTLLGVWALGQKNIPHSVIWAGDDVLLSPTEWAQRFQKGVDYHRALIASGI
ncbi:MAG: Fic family protein [Pseudomonadota bacterium]